MVVIRLSRGGSHKKPFYQIVAADRRSACQGKYLERLGFFNPIAKGEAQRLSLDQERVNYWLGVGAKPSERVASLLKEAAKPELTQAKKEKKIAKFRAKAQAKIDAAAKSEKEDEAKSAPAEQTEEAK